MRRDLMLATISSSLLYYVGECIVWFSCDVAIGNLVKSLISQKPIGFYPLIIILLLRFDQLWVGFG